jgi:hypothetical protein
MTWLFTTPASPRWWVRELDQPAHRCSAPFGWEHHPGHLGSDARSDPNQPPRASSSGWVGGASLRLAPELGPARGRSSRVGTALLSLLLAEPASVLRRHAPAMLPMRSFRFTSSPFARQGPRRGRPLHHAMPGVRLVRVLDARVALSMLAHRRDVVGCSLQSTVFNEHPRVAAISDPLARSLPSTARTLCPAALRGWVRRRPREAPSRRGFGASDSDGGAVGPHHRSWSGASLVRHGQRAGGPPSRAWRVGGRAGRIFCGPLPKLFATDTPVHRPLQSFGMLRVIRLLGARRTTSRASKPGAPSTAGSRRSKERRAATADLARGHRPLPTCFSRAAPRARYASASRPDVPHAAHRLLSIERARSTPRTTANPDGDTGQCCRQAIDPRIDRPVHALRGVEHPVGHNTPASTTARRGGFTPNGSWSGHPMSPGDDRSRWKNDPDGGAEAAS